ncbi:unnamed protein product [Penicillium roqueforti FM164]|uniref:Genomic scaffold, ProqFM164S04 n=1 Tax=Penicillium roqueforti (strain FM164) TaxID=1365484 RepID=W6QN97_PENRF|nr:unnamed protein product [Penicillium roqueforti FM164]
MTSILENSGEDWGESREEQNTQKTEYPSEKEADEQEYPESKRSPSLSLFRAVSFAGRFLPALQYYIFQILQLLHS